ncbi:tyrosine-type recombinase/integrase [Gimibacter soli]|uniref:Tyrosine-type recombinase/integrase n=1 Tax=Gimibacter soli TaxID=3024400 RepID=A0AAE9XSS6_9PROT|nr:site-specific integrase [Gimibacter soli]WCL54400.1 tyrosine-type recombinase/integrase [Gimibacter soli]
MPKINKTLVDSLTSTEKDFVLWDDEVKGFGVRVWPSEKRTFFFQYRPRGFRQIKKITLGHHGKVTAEEARRQAKTYAGQVSAGGDPAADIAMKQKEKAQQVLLADFCDRYLEAADKGLILGRSGKPKKESTLKIDRGRVAQHIKPLLGKISVKDISQADISKFIKDVTVGKTAKDVESGNLRGRTVVKGGAGTATRTVGLLGSIMSYAVSEGLIAYNPVTGVKKPAYVKRTTRLTKKEYLKLGNGLEKSEWEGDTYQAILAVRLFALTGCRKAEIINLKWDEVDFTNRCLRLGDSKTGESVRPLGKLAIDLLKNAPRSNECDFVLPGARQKTKPFGGMARAWKRILKRSELTGFTIHTLRHSYASMAGDLGYSEITIGALIGHAAGSVTSRYVHHLDEVLLAAADRVSEAIDTAMSEKNDD